MLGLKLKVNKEVGFFNSNTQTYLPNSDPILPKRTTASFLSKDYITTTLSDNNSSQTRLLKEPLEIIPEDGTLPASKFQ